MKYSFKSDVFEFYHYRFIKQKIINIKNCLEYQKFYFVNKANLL